VLLDWRERPDRESRTSERYGEAAFRRCKVNYLTRTLLPQREGALIWGAGPVGKAFARELIRQGTAVRAFVELDARKIGQTIHGAPVIAPADIARYRSALALAAVGQRHAREEIRNALHRAGWREGSDFVTVA
jgi:FlaA1/EpsC-like NDP-sugar epimerase